MDPDSDTSSESNILSIKSVDSLKEESDGGSRDIYDQESMYLLSLS